MRPLGLELCFELRQILFVQYLPQGGKEKGKDSRSDKQRSLERHNTHAALRAPESTVPEPTKLARAQGRGDTLGTHKLSYIDPQVEISVLLFHRSKTIRGKELPKGRTLNSTSPFLNLRIAAS